MNPVEHQATVDKGLKMKIKRKNVTGALSPGSNRTEASKHEIIKGESKGLGSSPPGSVGGSKVMGPPITEGTTLVGATSTLDKLKLTLAEKEKAGKTPVTALVRNPHKRTHKDRTKDSHGTNNVNMVVSLASNTNLNNSTNTISSSTVTSTNGQLLPSSNVMVELNRISSPMSIKKESTPPSDPYEFNAKVEDRIGLPMKKAKVEKMENPPSPSPGTTAPTDMDTDEHQRDASTEMSSVSTATDPDCLGPCEPGTSVVLEGIVWNETENGILVVNVTWRGKTYVGTLMDATKHAWAPPRLNCDSPANEEGRRTPRGRGKRGRNAVTPPVVDLGERRLRKRRTNNNNPYAAPPSPAKSETTNANGKRRGRPADLDLDLENIRTSKRPRTTKGNFATVPENGFIECPEPNCMKKYRHINGLKYHQAHAHKTYEDAEDSKEDIKVEDNTPDEEKEPSKDIPVSPSGKGRAGRKASSNSQGDHSNLSNSGDTKSDKTKKTKKEEKSETKKALDKQPTVSLTDVNMDSKSGASTFVTTVSQLSSVTTVSVVPSTAGTQSTSTTTVASTPITTATTSSDKPKKSKGDKSEKKSKHRSIIPVPSSLPGTVSTVSTHAQISIAASPIQSGTGLKPIQPKPTVLGETSSLNPLVGLKEKKAKKKKNKDKDKDRERSKSSDKTSDHKSKDSKSDVTVIKPTDNSGTLTMGLGGSKPLEALAKMSTPPELQKQASAPLNATPVKTTGSPPELQKQPPALPKVNSPPKVTNVTDARPPSSLSMNSPIANANNVNAKDSSDANAQSPAYSDISDANDSGSNLDGDQVQVQVKKEPQEAPAQEASKSQAVSGERPPSQGYTGNMYGGYYPPQNFQSPTTSSPQPNKDAASKPSPNPNREAEKLVKPSKVMIKTERKEEVKDGKEPENGAKPNIAQMREYQERMMHAQQMAQYQQYMGAYSYGVDMRALATNPEYKAQYEWMMEQERARREYMEQQKHAMNKSMDGKVKPLDLNTKAIDLSKQGKESPGGSSTGSETRNNKPLESSTMKSKEGSSMMSDQRMSDQRKDVSKFSEGQKEGDGKGLSEGRPLEGRGPPYPPGFERQQEEYRRYFMYQQQRLEHKRYMEQQQGKDGDPSRKPPHPSRDGPGHSPHGHSPHGREMEYPANRGDPLHPMNRDQHRPQGRELQHPMGRESHPQVPRSQSGPRPESHSPYNKMNSRPNPDNKSEKDKLTKADASSVSLPASPAGKPKDSQAGNPNSYGQYYPQGYPGYTGHVPYDPNHAMYPQNPAIGYAASPNSIPPYAAQAHMRGNYPENSKGAGTPSPSGKGSLPPPGAQEGKALELLQQKAANYYNSHSPQTPHSKVKNLKDGSRMDKGPMQSPGKDLDRPDSRSSSSSGKEKDKDRKSPPTQRHVHTHHHTHLVGPAYSLYGPYGALISSPQAPANQSVPFVPPK